jgi:hypothetical protein
LRQLRIRCPVGAGTRLPHIITITIIILSPNLNPTPNPTGRINIGSVDSFGSKLIDAPRFASRYGPQVTHGLRRKRCVKELLIEETSVGGSHENGSLGL